MNYSSAVSNETPVLLAATRGRRRALESLLRAKACPDGDPKQHISPVVAAAQRDLVPIVRALVLAKADVLHNDDVSTSKALDFAVLKDSAAMCSILAETILSSAEQDDSLLSSSPVATAGPSSDPFEERAAAEARSESLLLSSLSAARSESLLSAALEQAVVVESLNAALALIAAKASPDERTLDQVVTGGHSEVCAALIRNKVDPNTTLRQRNSSNLLHVATMVGWFAEKAAVLARECCTFVEHGPHGRRGGEAEEDDDEDEDGWWWWSWWWWWWWW